MNNIESPVQIVRDSAGWYRWTYELDSGTNRSMLKLYLLIFALIVLIPGAILFFMIYGRSISHGFWSGTGAYLGIWMLILIAVELLVILIYKGIEKMKGGITEYPYAMTDEFIIVHPGNKMAPRSYLQTDFSNVREVKAEPENDLILLYEIARVTHVFVPKEDFPFVLNFIQDRVQKKG